MRVLFDPQIFSMQRYGGISRYYCELASALSRRPGVKAAICAPWYGNAYLAAMPWGLRRGFPSLNTQRMYYLRRAIGLLAEEIITRSFRPDVVHETYYASKVRGPRNVARIVTVYDMIHERLPQFFDKTDSTASLKAEAVRRADHVVCISEATRLDVMDILGVSAQRISVTYLASNVPAAPEPSTACGKNGRPYILYVGQRHAYKNFWPFLSAVQASRALADFDVVCFGGGDFNEREISQLAAIGFPRQRLVYAAGDDEALALAYRAARCFVYPSLYEGFGIPPLEAMANDCPVVCAASSSIPEVVGDAGEYFDPLDQESMRRAIERVALSDQRCGELSTAGRLRRLLFSWDRCADQTLAVYERTAH